MKWTKEQLQVLNSHGKNLLVSAAAGSGKTAVLVEKICRLVINDGVSLDNMLIVTFTNAAAAEMRNRIREALRSALRDGIGDAVFIRSQLSAVSHAEICTFDSFAQHLVRNYYYIIGVDPSLKICDEDKSKLLQNEAMDELFKKKYEHSDADFLYFLDRYSSSKNDNDVRTLILSLFEYCRNLPEPMEFLRNTDFDPKQLYEYSAKKCTELIGLCAEYCKLLSEVFVENNMPVFKQKVDITWSDLDSIYQNLLNGHVEQAYSAIADYKPVTLKGSKEENETKKTIAGTVDAFWKNGVLEMLKLCRKKYASVSMDVLKEELDIVRKPISILCSLTGEFASAYAEKKKKAGLMDFSDGEHYAIDILKNDKVRSECREKYKYIFTDESQDSNAVLEAITQSVSSGNNVFSVGDIKQSIYRFRNADPELFLDKYKLYKSGADENSEAIDLNKNFRSKRTIIDFVNDLFVRLITPESSDMEYDEDAALKAGNEYNGKLLYTPELYIADLSQDDIDDSEIEELKKNELEALMAIEIIQKYHGCKIESDGEERTLEYGDMVILLSSLKDKAQTYNTALSAAGIPVTIDRSEGFFDTPEVQILINLLKVIDNFKQDIPLVSVLHFRSFGFTADMLGQIRVYSAEHSSKKQSFAEAFKLFANAEDSEASLRQKCVDFLQKIEDWRIKAKAMPLADFISLLISESGIKLFALGLNGGGQRAANLNALTEKAELFEQSECSGLSGFIAYTQILADKKNDIRTNQAKASEIGDNAVRIMTIHASKGLEFPFVLLASCDTRLIHNSDSKGFVINKNYGMSCCVFNPKTYIKAEPFSYSLIKDAEITAERAERIRVLYVAATRAQDILVMSGCCRKAAEIEDKRALLRLSGHRCANYLEMIYPSYDPKHVYIYSRDELSAVGSENTGRITEIKNNLANGFKIDYSEAEMSEEEIKKRLSYDFSEPEDCVKRKYSVSELAQIKRNEEGICGLYSAGNKTSEKTEYDFGAPLFVSGKIKLNAAEIGTAYHNVMEHLDFKNADKSPEGIKSFMQGLADKNILTQAELDAVDPYHISAFFDSQIGQDVCSAEEVYKETPFVIKHTYRGRQVLVQGTIDCWYIKDGKLYLLDYKSNYIDKGKLDEEKERLRQEYIPQLELYKEALEKIIGKKVEAAYLYLLSADSFTLCR